MINPCLWASWKTLSERNKQGNKIMSGDKRMVDLSGADLSGARFSEACFSGADLSGACFSEADLSGATLSGIDFSTGNSVKEGLNATNKESTQ